MTIGRTLRFGWWNTALVPASGRARTDGDIGQRMELSRNILGRLLAQGNGLDVLALGEITSKLADDAVSDVVDRGRFGRVIDDARKIVILYDTTTLRIVHDASLTAMSHGKNVNAGRYVIFEIGRDIFHLVAAHWPSHCFETKAGPQRSHCANKLQDLVRDLNSCIEFPIIILLGDFNDEPFSPALTNSLQGTRDRRSVRKSADLLYNPFWRRLGEREPLDIEAQQPLGAGTHFSETAPATSWYTFDQALVSAALLRGLGWTLIESATSELVLPELLTKSGRMRAGFDHLPIVVTLEYKPAGEAG